MHRNDLLLHLATYQRHHPDEGETVQRLMAFVESNPDCFERSLLCGHLTASAWLVNRAGTHTLLTHHRKLDMWLQPGGHADGQTDLLQVALQEAREESGLPELFPLSKDLFDVDVHLIPSRPETPAHYHYDIRYLIQCGEDETYTVSDESHALSWVKIDQIQVYTLEESILRMARKWAARSDPSLPGDG